MWKNQVYEGLDVVEVTATGAHSEGDWATEDGFSGIVANDVASGAKVLLKLHGAFEVPADAADEYTKGDKVMITAGTAQPYSTGDYNAIALEDKASNGATKLKVWLVFPAIPGGS